MAPPRQTGKKGKKGGKPAKPTRFEDFEKEQAPERSTTSGAARRAEAKARALAKPLPKRLPKNFTDVRAKSRSGKAQSSVQASGKTDKHAKTKHEFIQRKKAEALAQFKQEKQLAKAQATDARTILAPSEVPALAPSAAEPTREFVAVTGSYERLLYGLQGAATRGNQGQGQDELTVSFKPLFMFPAHVSSIRTAACAGTGSRWLATGGNDESIKVWDLKKKVEVGGLTGHSGTITSVHFPSKGFLITSSEDGLINVYRAREWSLLVTLKGHKGAVHDVATHPTGKVALSVGKDRTVRMWDLMRGKPAASTKIPTSADKIAWDTKGSRFAVVAGPSMRVYDTAMNLVGETQTRVRWHDVLFYSFRDEENRAHEALIAAGEDKMVHVFDAEHPFEREGVPTFREVAQLTGHGNRYVQPLGFSAYSDGHRTDKIIVSVSVKAISLLPVLVEDDVVPLCTTASSDGMVRAFDLSSVGDLLAKSSSEPVEFTAVGHYSTKGTRLTCLSTAGVLEAKPDRKDKGKDKAVQIDAGDEGSDQEMQGADSDDAGGDEDVDTDAEEAELQELERQIEQAKKEGLLEEYSSSDDGENDDFGESVDDDASEPEPNEEGESELEQEPEEESD